MRLIDVLQRYLDSPDFHDVVLTDVNQRGKFGNTPLHIACWRGNIEDVEVLLAAGAEVDAEGEVGDRPLHEASRRGHVAIVKRLLEAGASVDVLNDFLQRPKDLAVSLGETEVVAVLDAWKKPRG